METPYQSEPPAAPPPLDPDATDPADEYYDETYAHSMGENLLVAGLILVGIVLIGLFAFSQHPSSPATTTPATAGSNSSSSSTSSGSSSSSNTSPAALARDVQRKNDLKSIAVLCTQYLSAQGAYPTTLDQLLSTGLVTKVPTDPKTGKAYAYIPNSDPTTGFTLKAILENPKDTDGPVYTISVS